MTTDRNLFFWTTAILKRNPLCQSGYCRTLKLLKTQFKVQPLLETVVVNPKSMHYN